jgi:hypothetical protein
MKKILMKYLVIFALLPFAVELLADTSPTPNSTGPLSDFSMLIGHWRGDGLGGICEETWLPESGGIMLGTFKLISEGKVSFFEIMSLSIDSLGPAVKVKHFNSDMTAWEEKADMVTFRYDSANADRIFFGGLSFSKPANDSLRIGVTFKMKDGTTREEFIHCKKVELK